MLHCPIIALFIYFLLVTVDTNTSAWVLQINNRCKIHGSCPSCRGRQHAKGPFIAIQWVINSLY